MKVWHIVTEWSYSHHIPVISRRYPWISPPHFRLFFAINISNYSYGISHTSIPPTSSPTPVLTVVEGEGSLLGRPTGASRPQCSMRSAEKMAGFLQGLVNVPFWGLVSHHLQISVGDYIPNSWMILGHLPTPVLSHGGSPVVTMG